jgi:hypothetical protein
MPKDSKEIIEGEKRALSISLVKYPQQPPAQRASGPEGAAGHLIL